MKTFGGKVLFLDRSDINTDEIIPAKYLTEVTKEALTPYLLEDLKITGFEPSKDIAGKSVIVTRENFGCGSSREHAPWALEVNNINVVIGVSFARIFRQNMYNCGMMAIELSNDQIDMLFEKYAGKSAEMQFDLDKSTLTVSTDGSQDIIEYKVSDFDAQLVKEGGWVEFADKKY